MENITNFGSHSFFYLEEDPRSKNWFLIDSPATVATIIATYLIFVTKIGPAMMQNRKAYEFKTFMLLFNLFQIIYCGVLVIYSAIPFTQFNPWCATLSFREEFSILSKLSYAFFLLKIVDLLETVVFVLRKKQNQVSFLHTFHHVYVLILGYVHTRYLPGSQIALLTFLNGIVHVVMYYYYLQVALVKRSIWWKKYLTSLQLVQLAALVGCMIPSMLRPTCTYPKWPIFTLMFVPTSVLVEEFARFYLKSYRYKVKKSE